MQITPYLNFQGDCREAFTLYAELFGGRIAEVLTYDQAPPGSEMPGLPPEWAGKVMHAQLVVGDQTIMASDCPPAMYRAPQGTFVHLEFPEPGEAEEVFARLAEGGIIAMPMAETFWAYAFGMVVDRFGMPWMVSRGRPM